MTDRPVSIWHTQAVHDAATIVLALHPGIGPASHALVEVTLPALDAAAGQLRTAAALMVRSAVGVWEVRRLYTADHEIPGAVAVVVIGVW